MRHVEAEILSVADNVADAIRSHGRQPVASALNLSHAELDALLQDARQLTVAELFVCARELGVRASSLLDAEALLD